MEIKTQKQKRISLKKLENDVEIDSNCSSNKSNDEKNNQSEDSILSNNATCSSGCISSCSFHSSQIINIELFYYINKDLRNTEILIQEDKTINDLICFSLNIINEELISNKLNLSEPGQRRGQHRFQRRLHRWMPDYGCKGFGPDNLCVGTNIRHNENRCK